jgi:hypothetical protein
VDLDPPEPIRALADTVAVERFVHAPLLDSEERVEADPILADPEEFHGLPSPHRSRDVLGHHRHFSGGGGIAWFPASIKIHALTVFQGVMPEFSPQILLG